MRKLLLCLIAICPLTTMAQKVPSQMSQSYALTLDDVIQLALDRSVDALVAKHTFLGSYWEYRSYKAQFLPSFSLTGNLPSFDRSLVALQDPKTGEYIYQQNYAMSNSLALNVVQNIGFTGGTISLSTSLERLDQYAPSRQVNYNTSPISVILDQPIGSFNKLRWDRKIEPVKYDLAKYTFLEARQSIINNAVALYFDLLIAQKNLEIAKQNYVATDTLYQISKRRFEIGTIKQSDLLQLELRLLNEGISINTNQLQLNLSRARLGSYLGYGADEPLALAMPQDVPSIMIELEKAYQLSTTNSSFNYQQKVQRLEADRAVAQAKANRNPQVSLYARFGLNQVGDNIGGAYQNPLDQQTVRLGITVPLFDGGVARGRQKMALSQKDVVEATIEKNAIDRRHEIFLKVMQFNNQWQQCNISRRANEVADLRYRLSLDQFATGQLSVLELNTAQSERNDAQNRLLNELYNYWNYYYSIEGLTLYDFLNNKNISVDFDQMTK